MKKKILLSTLILLISFNAIAQSYTQKGIDAREDMKFDDAIYWLTKGAEEDGSAFAMMHLVEIYLENGKYKNIEKAKHWFEKVRPLVQNLANTGDVNAMNNLGLIYYELEDYSNAVKWFEKVANLGYANAAMMLGDIYCSSHVKLSIENYEKGIYWYEKAFNLGNTKAISGLGLANEELAIIKKANGELANYEKAIYWYEKGANLGNVHHMMALGYIYERAPKNIPLAKEWFRKACDAGDKYGCEEYRRLNKE